MLLLSLTEDTHGGACSGGNCSRDVQQAPQRELARARANPRAVRVGTDIIARRILIYDGVGPSGSRRAVTRSGFSAPSTPDTLTTRHNLAFVYRSIGRDADAAAVEKGRGGGYAR